MTKIYIFFLFFVLISCDVNAQTKVTGKVTYNCYVNIGLGVSNFEANLYFNRDSSYFQTVNTTSTKDTSSIVQVDKVIEAKVLLGIKDTIGLKIITDRKSNIMYSREILISRLIPVFENIPRLDWVIQDETKKIGSNVCQRATCTFRGRNYIAWFATDINIGAGPYKFQGLPGLILEVTDDQGKISFTMKDITIPYRSNIPINSNYIPTPISRVDYVILAKKSVERLVQYLQSSSRTDNTTGKITVKSSIIGIEDLNVPL